MENTPEAPVTPEVKSEATPNTNTEQTTSPAPAAPDMHGFTSDQLADMKKFFDSQGGYEKVKSRISNPQNYSEPKVEQNVLNTPAPNDVPQQPAQAQEQTNNQYVPPKGAWSMRDLALKNYLESLSKKEQYAGISKELADGTIIDEMKGLGMHAFNADGSLNPDPFFKYLDLRAKTVPAAQTSTTPEASAAPTVEYAPYDEKNLTMQQAVAILQQDSALKAQGQGGHPNAQQAEEFMKKILNKKQK